jgi:hypothetical protein
MKAQDQSAAMTDELPGIPVAKKRGRPKSEDSMTNAERQAKYRKARKLMKTGDRISATITRFAREFDVSEDHVTRALLRFALCNRNWSQTGFAAYEVKGG